MLRSSLKSVALVLASIAFAISAEAGSLFAPFSFDSGDVLPKGVRSVRVLGFTTEIENRWNGSGGIEPLAAKFNKGITYRELVEAQADVNDRAQLKGYLLSKDVSMEAEVGDARGVVNTRLTSTIPVMAYGLTENLTLAVIVPILYSNVNVSTGWAPNAQFQGALDGLSADGKHSKKLSFESRLQNVVQTKVTGYGYEALTSEQHQEIGDVTIGTKYLLMRDKDWTVSMSGRVAMPTGRAAGTSKLIDVAPGDGQWDAGIGATAEYRVLPRMTFVASTSLLYQFASRKPQRIPNVRWERATPDIDPDVEEKLGDMAIGVVGVKYNPFELWTLSTQYSAQYRGPDQYRGSAFSAERYQWMSDETEQELQAIQGGITFSTIPLFKLGSFSIPFETTLSAATTVGGRNAGKTFLAAWEVALFF